MWQGSDESSRVLRFFLDRLDVVFVISVTFKHLDHRIPQRHPLCAVICGSFTQSHRSDDRIFISCMCSDLTLTFIQTDTLLFLLSRIREALPLKSVRTLINPGHVSCDRIRHIGSHDRLDKIHDHSFLCPISYSARRHPDIFPVRS